MGFALGRVATLALREGGIATEGITVGGLTGRREGELAGAEEGGVLVELCLAIWRPGRKGLTLCGGSIGYPSRRIATGVPGKGIEGGESSPEDVWETSRGRGGEGERERAGGARSEVAGERSAGV